MTVPCWKTEHHGKAYRVRAIFAELRPYRDEVFDLTEDGAEYVVPGTMRLAAGKPGGRNSTSLHSRFLKLVRRAGLTPWARLFHNLRASRETDSAATFPLHVVTSWLGHSPKNLCPSD